MHATIQNVHRADNGELSARVSTRAGTATILARGDTTFFEPGAVCSIEFEVDAPLQLGLNARLSSERTFALGETGNEIQMTGLVEGVDPDGLVYFRIGQDSLMMIEAPPGLFSEGCWLELTFARESIRIYVT